MNLSQTINNVLPTLRKYFFDDGFFSTASTFNDIKVVPFSTILTKWGLCLNFNLQPMESMLHTDRCFEMYKLRNLLNFCFFRVSSDFFYKPPDWFEAYRTGRANPSLPWKTESKFFGLYIENSPNSLQNNYQPLQGSRVIIHNTDEFSFRAGQHFQYKAYEWIFISFIPTLTIIDKALVSWKPERRNCFFDQEKNLKYFKIYSRNNCEHECLSKSMLETCGCIPFYMIRELTALKKSKTILIFSQRITK